MSLNEEKVLILKMLEEGKINSEEARRLLEALEMSSGENVKSARQETQGRQKNFQDELSKIRDRINEWRKEIKSNYSQKDFDQMMEEFGARIEKFGKGFATATFGIVDRIVDFVGSFIDTNMFNFFGPYPTVEKTFEARACQGGQLSIEAVNGPVTVKKHLDDNVLIKTKIKAPEGTAEKAVEYSADEASVAVKFNKTNNTSVSHEVFIPGSVKFDKIMLTTSNGKIYVEDTLSREIECITWNAPVELMGVNSEKIGVSTKNAAVQVSYTIGQNIDVNTTNSIVVIKHIKAGSINAVTTNGRVSVENVQNPGDLPEICLNVKTTNGGIKVNFNDVDRRGYKVRAKTSNGGINLLIPEIVYHTVNKQDSEMKYVEAESVGYDQYPEKVNISAETTNGYIEVVK